MNELQITHKIQSGIVLTAGSEAIPMERLSFDERSARLVEARI